MARLTRPLRLLLLIALASSTASAIPASHIFARQKSCAADGFDSCGKDFPDYFCCQTGTKCLSLAGATTVMCCPEGAKCSTLKPITCNIRAQDAEKDVTVPLKTTVFDVALEKCGDKLCCPFGFSCVDGKDGKECQQDQDQSKPPKARQQVSKTSTATQEPTQEPSADPTKTADATETSTEVSTSTATNDLANSGTDSGKSGPDTTSIIGGVVGSCAILLIVAVVLFVCVRKRAKRRSKGPEMIHGRNISEPITQPDTYRSEFMRRDTYGSNDSNSGLNQQRDTYLSNNGGLAPPARESRLRRLTLRSNKPRLSIPNHFANGSPNPSVAESDSHSSITSYDNVRTGNVSLAPIRAMKASSRHLKTKSRHLKPEMARLPSRNRRSGASEQINIFADPLSVPGESHGGGYARETCFTDLMKEADLGEMQKGKPYVPTGTTPRI